jgi:hypothetical protein
MSRTARRCAQGARHRHYRNARARSIQAWFLRESVFPAPAASAKQVSDLRKKLAAEICDRR